MKTTYILAGGDGRKYPDYGRRLAEEIHKRVSRPRILSCFFSSPPEAWPEKHAKWKIWFAEYFLDCPYDIAKPETVLHQIQQADVIYLHGGHTPLLMEALKNHGELQQACQGKIVIGGSAGAQFLSKHFLSASRGVFGEGTGIVDANVMVHYGAPSVGGRNRTPEEWERDKTKFQNLIGREQKITVLPEGELVIWQEVAEAVSE